jgi:hypothetical protein
MLGACYGTEQPVTPLQMPLATVPEAHTAAETRGVLPVTPQLATPAHEESQSSSKRRASESPGSVLSPLPPRRIFNGDTMAIMAHSAESYDTHFTDQIGTSDTDPEFFDDDGSESDQGQVSSHSDPSRPSAFSERVRPSPKTP